MIGIGYDYTFDGATFGRWDGRPLDSHDRGEIVDTLVRRAFNISRWQGERLYSVGEHSLVVAGLAALLATREGYEAVFVRTCIRYGAAHDLGETLGLGDIAAPFLRAHPKIAAIVRQHQRAAEDLLDTVPRAEVAAIVKKADQLAAHLERRILFFDTSGRCDSPEARALFDELGLSFWGRTPPAFLAGAWRSPIRTPLEWLAYLLRAPLNPREPMRIEVFGVKVFEQVAEQTDPATALDPAREAEEVSDGNGAAAISAQMEAAT